LILTLLLLEVLGGSAAGEAVQYPLVLCYHQVVETEAGLEPGYPVILASDLERQFRYLSENGIRGLTMSEYVAAIGEPNPPRDAVLLTFDDNYETVYTIVYPLLRKYGLRATAFVRTSKVGRENSINPHQTWLTWEQCREIQQSGYVDIEAHGDASHDRIHGYLGDKLRLGPYLVTQRVDRATGQAETEMAYRNRVLKELRTCKRIIDEQLEKDTKAFCWPFGTSNETSLYLAREAGYHVTFCLNGDGRPNGDRVRYHSPENWEKVIALAKPGARPLPISADPMPQAAPTRLVKATTPVVSVAPPSRASGLLRRAGLAALAMATGGAVWALCLFVLIRPRPQSVRCESDPGTDAAGDGP